MFIAVSENLPKTSYIKMVDIWLIFNLMIPFFEVTTEMHFACYLRAWTRFFVASKDMYFAVRYFSAVDLWFPWGKALCYGVYKTNLVNKYCVLPFWDSRSLYIWFPGFAAHIYWQPEDWWVPRNKSSRKTAEGSWKTLNPQKYCSFLVFKLN